MALKTIMIFMKYYLWLAIFLCFFTDGMQQKQDALEVVGIHEIESAISIDRDSKYECGRCIKQFVDWLTAVRLNKKDFNDLESAGLDDVPGVPAAMFMNSTVKKKTD
jgi:hypothetical protein